MRQRHGYSLVEVLVGSAAALIILLAVADMEIRAWRFSRADEQNMISKAEASVAIDRFAMDARQASGFSLAQPGASSVTLVVPGGAVTYWYDSVARTVVREQAGARQVLASSAAALAFSAEAGGKVLRMDLQVQLTGGTLFRLETQVAPRLAP